MNGFKKRYQEEFLTPLQQQQIAVVNATHKKAALPDYSVDIVVLRHAYRHFYKPEKFISSLKQSLRPGGRVVVVDSYTDDSLSDFDVNSIPPYDRRCKHMKSMQAHRDHFESAGFKLTRSEETPTHAVLTEWTLR